MDLPSQVSVWFRVAMFVLILLVPLQAFGQEIVVEPGDAGMVEDGGDAAVPTDASVADAASAADADGLTVTPFGAVEMVYALNPRSPSNGRNNFRLNDSRDRALTIPNVVAGLDASYGPFLAHLAFQVGEMPGIYYSPTDNVRWQNVQEAYAGATFGRVTATCGIYLSPVGPEGMTTSGSNNTPPGQDAPGTSAQNASNAAISRPFNFFGLPFYHPACRVGFNLGRGYTLGAWITNGWNNVSDTNTTPTGILSLQYGSHRVSWSVLAMGGNERVTGAPEGSPVRWLFDSWLQWHPRDNLAFVAQLNGGFEPNRFGVSAWAAGSLAVRWHFHPKLYLAARGEVFWERVAANADGAASPIFWPAGANWLASGTFTLAYRPHPNLLVRIEYRHDHAGGNAFYAGQVTGDGSTEHPFVPNTDQQDTATFAATAWF